MAITRMLPNAIHVSEFAPASWGERENGTCTFQAAATALAAAQGHPTTQQGVIDLMLSMKDASFKRGECAMNGAATIANVAKELRNRGADIAIEWDYQGDQIPHDWHSLIAQNAGIKPLVMQTSKAYMLYDVDGVHEDANVNYHAYAIVGIAGNGYVTSDPNNPHVMSTFDIYPYALQASDGKLYGIAPASPCGLIMLNMQTQTPQAQPTTGGTPPMDIPADLTSQGWHDDGTTLTAPNGQPVVRGFRNYLYANPVIWHVASNPVAGEYATAYGARQDFYGIMLQFFTDGGRIGIGPAGQLCAEYEQTQIPAMQAKINTLAAQVNTLTTQLAEASTQPLPVSQPTQQNAISISVDAAALTNLIMPNLLNAMRQQTISPASSQGGVTQ